MKKLSKEEIKEILGEDKQNSILAEELFRKGVRDSLSINKQNKLWNFVNSSFGLFLLSAIFISGFSSIYNILDTSNKSELTRLTQIEKLDIEIIGRLTQFASILKSNEQRLIDDSRLLDSLTYNKAYDSFFANLIRNSPKEAEFDDYFVSYQEFNDRSLLSLITELQLVVTEEPLQRKIENVILFLHQNTLFKYENPYILNGNEFSENWNSFMDNVILDRWKNKWAFRNCPEDNQLCLAKK